MSILQERVVNMVTKLIHRRMRITVTNAFRLYMNAKERKKQHMQRLQQ